jgi:hypothetical protein
LREYVLPISSSTSGVTYDLHFGNYVSESRSKDEIHHLRNALYSCKLVYEGGNVVHRAAFTALSACGMYVDSGFHYAAVVPRRVRNRIIGPWIWHDWPSSTHDALRCVRPRLNRFPP